jgi:isopenicillin-N N-acyltransferase-like protein
MEKIRVLDVSGSFYNMGKVHGEHFRDEIHMFTEDRIKLSSTDVWTGRKLSREAVLELADACVAEHEAYSPELMDELRGISDATGLSLGALIINNGFTDFIDVVYAKGAEYQAQQPEQVADNCTAFLVPKDIAADGNAIYGQTWDMHATATPYVMLLRGKPDNAPQFLSFTITGCLGMIGMNEHGITVGINNISGGDGQIGVTWIFVIRKILMQDNIEDALKCITEAKLAGAHNYLLMDKHGKGYNIEAMSTRYYITELDSESVVHTNHCLVDYTRYVERDRAEASMASSKARLARAYELLNDKPITTEKLMELTRDNETICVRPNPPWHVESSGAAIMRPSTGDFWAVWGLPAENEYEHFTI